MAASAASGVVVAAVAKSASLPAAASAVPTINVTLAMPPSADPEWLHYAQYIGAPLVAVIAACIAGAIAFRQWRTSHEKLKLDRFDRRLKVYEASLELLKSIVRADLDGTEVLIYRGWITQAKWLFDDDVAHWMKALSDIAKAAMSWQHEVDYKRTPGMRREKPEVLEELRQRADKWHEAYIEKIGHYMLVDRDASELKKLAPPIAPAARGLPLRMHDDSSFDA